MHNLISVKKAQISDETVQAVSARDLHKILGVKKQFTDWARIYTKKFVKNQDFTPLRVHQTSGYYQEDYIFTLDMAKHVAMMSDTEKSYQVRQYFIECEKRLIQIAKKDANFALFRDAARLEYRPMTDTIKEERKKVGKEAQFYHYANEADMINRIIFGETAKQYKERHGINKNESLRDCLTERQIKCLVDLQRANTVFISMGMEFEVRKSQLKQLFMRNHSEALIEEHILLEA